MPSWELFDDQPQEYRDRVLPPEVTARVSVEQASMFGWGRYAGASGQSIGMRAGRQRADQPSRLVEMDFPIDREETTRGRASMNSRPRWASCTRRKRRKERPGWELYRDGCPDGETPGDVAARADRFIARVHGIPGDVLAFSSGHIIRMIAARWLSLLSADGRVFFCDPASVGVLGFEHNDRDQPVIRRWNFVSQLFE